MKKLRRILLFPMGLINGLTELVNDKARDLENRLRFKKAIIDAGSTFSQETSIGLNSRILGGCTVNNCSVGMFSYLNRNVIIQNATVGNYCSIANDVMIGLGKHPLELFSTSPIFYKVRNAFRKTIIERDYKFDEYKVVLIGNDVWIGASSIVMDGVTVGDGAVIAAGSIVTKDVPPYAIVAGVPARILKYRFPKEKISEMLETKWWLEDPEKVYNNRLRLEKIITNEI